MNLKYTVAYKAYLTRMMRDGRYTEIIGHNAWVAAWFPTKPEACPDCGRKASICVNTLSKCSISPNNTEAL